MNAQLFWTLFAYALAAASGCLILDRWLQKIRIARLRRRRLRRLRALQSELNAAFDCAVLRHAKTK